MSEAVFCKFCFHLQEDNDETWCGHPHYAKINWPELEEASQDPKIINQNNDCPYYRLLDIVSDCCGARIKKGYHQNSRRSFNGVCFHTVYGHEFPNICSKCGYRCNSIWNGWDSIPDHLRAELSKRPWDVWQGEKRLD